MNDNSSPQKRSTRRAAFVAGALVILQGSTALYSLGDGIDDVVAELRSRPGAEAIIKCLIAVTLWAAVSQGSLHKDTLGRCPPQRKSR